MSFQPSEYQRAIYDFVSTGQGNAVIQAVAGSGKTTTIIGALKFMKGYVFLGAYNSKMAKELKERIVGMTNVKAGTFHSAGFAALRFGFKGNRFELDDKKVLKIIQNIVKDREDLKGLESGIADIVSMAKQRGFGVAGMIDIKNNTAWQDMIDHFGLDQNLPEDARMDQVIPLARQALNRSNQDLDIIDFNDMVYLPLVKNLRMLQNDWVLVDEAQDTNPTRRALARKMLKPNGRLICVGDSAQAVYGFTGSDNDALEQIKKDFNCIELPLTVSYRCPKAVVRHAQQWVNHIEAAQTAEEGSVEQLDYKDLLSNVKVGDAILCRFNKYLVNLCFKLIRNGIPAKIEGRAIGQGLINLAGRWKVKTFDALIKKLEVYLEREVQKALEKGQEVKADQLKDKVETLLVLIDRAREKGLTTLPELKEMIESMFTDTSEDQRGTMVVLSSVHRSKGLEWNKVYLLGRSELMPSPMARQEWQKIQEENLIYVAVTRAKQTLVEVNGVVEEKNVRQAT